MATQRPDFHASIGTIVRRKNLSVTGLVSSSEPGLWLLWVLPGILAANSVFFKERRENRPSATHFSVRRAFPLAQARHHFCRTFVESSLHRGERGGQLVMSLPCLAMLSPSAPWLLPSLLLVCQHKLPITSTWGSARLQRLHITPCSKSGGQVGWEPLHCFLKGLRLKRGPMLTVPLRPREELPIPTAHSRCHHLVKVFPHVV